MLTGQPEIATQVLHMVAGFAPELAPIAEQEAEHATNGIEQQLNAALRVRLNLRDPNFAIAAARHEAQLVREVTAETRRAITNIVIRAHRQGLHPYTVAPQIREMVGLTSRQANAVLTYADSMTRNGVKPAAAAERAVRYSGKLRTRRAKTIGRTETVRAMTMGRLASYEHAAANGLFDRALAEIEWASVQDDPTEICATLDGDRVPLGGTFDGLLPPAHPNCRCSVHLVLGR